MRLHRELIIMLFEIQFMATIGSIAGVTYMDNFDFEERYRNVYECDPFHWHPLHLPEHCAEMYENSIRSRLAKDTPFKIVQERDNVVNFPNHGYPTFEISNLYQPPNIQMVEYERPRLSPYDKMFELLRKDVERSPSAPTIGHMPNFGPVAIYHQPISKKSENMIKKISGAYAKAGKRIHGGEYYGKIEIQGHSQPEVDTVSLPPEDQTIKRKKKSRVVKLGFQDPIPQKPLPGENPCNPLYWYPRTIPEYCYNTISPKTVKPLPAPNPLPMMPMIPMPMPPISVPILLPGSMPIVPPMPAFPSSVQFLPPIPAPYGIPLPLPQRFPYGPGVPMNYLPAPVPYPYPPVPSLRSQIGLVPGIEGLVSSDGGINILPFSDAYSDMLEKHKQKRIRERLQKVLDDYDDSARRKKYKRFIG